MESLFFDGFSDFYEAEDTGGVLTESVIIDDDIPVAGELIDEDRTFKKVKSESNNDSQDFTELTINDFNVGNYVSRGMVVGGTIVLIQLTIILIISILRKAGS